MHSTNVDLSKIIDDRYLYDGSYFQEYYRNDPKREAMYLQERDRILKYFPQGGRILDVGCGVGGFLSKFDDRWEKYGIEPSDFAKEKAVKRDITMYPSLNTIGYEIMDVIVFRGTLQHINFPMQYLTQATMSLKKGGLLVILATPDADSLTYKIWGRLPALDAPRNWIVFGSRVMENILQRLNYQDIRILHPYWGTPYANPVSDFIRFFISLFFGWRKFAFPGNMMEIFAIKK